MTTVPFQAMLAALRSQREAAFDAAAEQLARANTLEQQLAEAQQRIAELEASTDQSAEPGA